MKVKARTRVEHTRTLPVSWCAPLTQEGTVEYGLKRVPYRFLPTTGAVFLNDASLSKHQITKMGMLVRQHYRNARHEPA